MRNFAPYLGRLAPTIFFAQGYSGHGTAITGIVGLAITGTITSGDGCLKPFEQLRHSNIITQPFPHKLGSYLDSRYYQQKDSH